MASNSEKTIAKAIANAQKVHDIVELFTDYVPDNPDETLTNLALLIITATDSYVQEGGLLVAYRTSASDRRKLFFTQKDSLEKRYIDISRAVLRQYKEDSSEHKQVAAMIAKIRSTKRPDKDPSMPDKEHNSRSQKSFDSLTGSFRLVISALESFDPPFVPVNTRVKISVLTTLADQLILATKNVTIASSVHDTMLDKRNDDLAKLKTVAKAIKESVGGQYGYDSNQYRQVKGISL